MNKMNNKGFSLVELIVVIAIMAVLMGVLAPTLIGNIEKSRESKDLQNLDTVYGRVNDALATEAVAEEAASGLKATKLSEILSGTSDLGTALKESIGSTAPELTATCNASSDIYVKIDVSDGNTQVTVFASKDGSAVNNCTKTKDKDNKAKPMSVSGN
ncbi:MAG: type II secretion system protein [Lachnospiraceae bacterium]|nr:type II secretion system protein [Lachnospiraceae bacterium]